jgi:hypothetical protein
VPTAQGAEITYLDGVMALFGPLASNLITQRSTNMPNFLDNYEDVATLNKWFIENFPMGRSDISIISHDPKDGLITIKASVWRDGADQFPAATNIANAVRDTYPNHMRKFYAEDCATSALGRAIIILKGSNKTATRDDMEKVEAAKPLSWTVDPTDEVIPVGTHLELIKDQLGAVEIPESPICAHGHMVLKSGKSKTTGKEWRGFMCIEKVKDKQCTPSWMKQTAAGDWYSPKDNSDYL